MSLAGSRLSQNVPYRETIASSSQAGFTIASWPEIKNAIERRKKRAARKEALQDALLMQAFEAQRRQQKKTVRKAP
jgi:hypothetical protein